MNNRTIKVLVEVDLSIDKIPSFEKWEDIVLSNNVGGIVNVIRKE